MSRTQYSTEQMGKAVINNSLPRIVINKVPRERGRNDADSQYTGEKLQVRLLTLDEKYRSHLLYHQIRAFEEKVYYSSDNFDVDILLKMFREMARRCRGTSDIYTVGGLRQALNQEIRKIRMRKRNKRLPPSEEAIQRDEVIEYFIWFFKYLEYLRELRGNFVTRIFNPLFKYFYDVSNVGPDRERSTDSAMSVSNLSIASHRSVGSNFSGLSDLTGWSSFQFSDLESQMSADDDIHDARKRMISKAALLLLSRELKDVKHLYDTSEMERTALRLSLLKDQTDHLIDNESIIKYELFSQDSEQAVCHLKVKTSRTYSLMRFIPDILKKFQVSAWLAKKWLEYDDRKTKDLKQRLAKLASLEEQLSKRLKLLSRDIQKHEQSLEKETNELQKLLKREERTNELQLSLHDYQQGIYVLEESLKQLDIEKKDISEKMSQAIKERNTRDYTGLQTMYERNKLQRFALERQVATMRFHENVVKTDMQVEFEVKANIIHFTNDVQDQCEELEQMLDREKKEKQTIQAALTPISRDKEIIANRLCEKEYPQNGLIAEYVGSSRIPILQHPHIPVGQFEIDSVPGNVQLLNTPRKVSFNSNRLPSIPATPDADW